MSRGSMKIKRNIFLFILLIAWPLMTFSEELEFLPGGGPNCWWSAGGSPYIINRPITLQDTIGSPETECRQPFTFSHQGMDEANEDDPEATDFLNGMCADSSRCHTSMFDVNDLNYGTALDAPSYCEDCNQSPPDLDRTPSRPVFHPPPDMDEKTQQAMQAYVAQGGDPKAFTQSLCFLQRKQGESISTAIGSVELNPCIMNIQDNTRTERNGRARAVAPLYRVNLCEGTSIESRSATGYGGICAGQTPCPINSNMTPNGFTLLSGQANAPSKAWTPGIYMHGLEPFNSNNNARGVFLHRAKASGGAYYCTDETCTGNSAGCTAVSEGYWSNLEYLTQERPSGAGGSARGELHFNYSTHERNQEEGYCGSN